MVLPVPKFHRNGASLLSRCSLFLLLVVGQTLCSSALAWNRGGHLVIGALIYRDLEQRAPQTVRELATLLQQHPAAAHWAREIAAAPELNAAEARFMLAAAFADDARRGTFKRYDRPKWHYVNFEYTPGRPRTDVATAQPVAGEMLSSLEENLRIVRDRNAPAVDRGVALSWAIHQLGDLAQPLHVTTLVTPELPAGDRGGNLLLVRATERARKGVNLHRLWDSGIAGPRFTLVEAHRRALQLQRDSVAMPPLARAPFKQVLRNQAKSSYDLAIEVVYLRGTLGYGTVRDQFRSPDDEEDRKETLNDSIPPRLPDGYTAQLKAVSRQQAVIAARFASALLAP